MLGRCKNLVTKTALTGRRINFNGKAKASDWNKAVSDAEKVVGYPTSFMSLRCLLSDELSNVALQMRKLVGTKHPLLKTARKFLYDGKHSLQTRGLLVLLVSKAAGPYTCALRATVDGLFPSQRNLAEITEMIYTAHMIHKGVVNLASVTPADGGLANMEFGNKMAVLSGDFLLANASTGLSELNNTKVVELMSRAISDLTEAEFSEMRDKDGNSNIPENSLTLEDWKRQTFLSSGSLLANACKASMLLAEQSAEIQEVAHHFGTNISYARQLSEEILGFMHSFEDNGSSVALTSLPVILLCGDDLNAAKNLHGLTEKQLVKEVRKSGILRECSEQCQHFGHLANEALQTFPESDAKKALKNMLQAVTAR